LTTQATKEQVMGNPVVHFEVLGKDGNALRDFYAKVFDWQFEQVMPEYAMTRPAGENGVAGGVGDAPEGQPGHLTFYVEVDDLAAALAKAEAAGGKTIAPPTDIPEGPSIALFADPEGHVMGLVKGM
jgi:predicted enzyme related to lactoylglutathione lyase